MATSNQIKAYMLKTNCTRNEAKAHFNNYQVEPLTLYKTNDMITMDGLMGGISILTPEGVQAVSKKVVNIGVTPPLVEDAVETWFTGYGLSYLMKVLSGTARKDETYICVIQGDNHRAEDTWMLQIAVSGMPSNKEKTQIVDNVLDSLPKKYRTIFKNNTSMTGLMKNTRIPTQIGVVNGTADL